MGDMQEIGLIAGATLELYMVGRTVPNAELNTRCDFRHHLQQLLLR